MTNREKLLELISDKKNVSSYQVVCELYALIDIATQFNDSKRGLAIWLDEEYSKDYYDFMKGVDLINEQKS